MSIVFNHHSNTVYIKGNSYNTDKVREHLLRKHEPLCKNHFLKAIRIKGATVMTYDWQSVFDIALEFGFLVEHKIINALIK